METVRGGAEDRVAAGWPHPDGEACEGVEGQMSDLLEVQGPLVEESICQDLGCRPRSKAPQLPGHRWRS